MFMYFKVYDAVFDEANLFISNDTKLLYDEYFHIDLEYQHDFGKEESDTPWRWRSTAITYKDFLHKLGIKE